MNNNELLKIKDKKEQFYMLRKEIIGESCREEKNYYQNPPLHFHAHVRVRHHEPLLRRGLRKR